MDDRQLKQKLRQDFILRQYPRRDAAVFTEENDHNPIILEDCPACRGTGKSCIHKRNGHTIIQKLVNCPKCESTGITEQMVHYFENDTPAIRVLANEEGWLTCPSCCWRFNLKDKDAWTGMRHKQCGQKLRIETNQT